MIKFQKKKQLILLKFYNVKEKLRLLLFLFSYRFNIFIFFNKLNTAEEMGSLSQHKPKNFSEGLSCSSSCSNLSSLF